MNAQHMFLLITINGNLQTVAQNYLGIFRIGRTITSELLFSYQFQATEGAQCASAIQIYT